MKETGKELIFLISQPRSGSTMLQHILGGHSKIHTLPEPWLMLPLVYSLRPSGIESEYNASLASKALSEFLRGLPDGNTNYYEYLKDFSLNIYRLAIQNSGKEYFLDKTPRYYHIIPELSEIFPSAKFIFLIRQPLAVLSSILNVSLRRNWKGLFWKDKANDLLKAPQLILDGYHRVKDRSILVRYEDIISNPIDTVQQICSAIGIDFEEDTLEYRGKVKFNSSSFIDRKSIYQHSSPVKKYVDEWKDTFSTAQLRYIARSYIQILGEDLIQEQGYSYNDILSEISPINFLEKSSLIPWKLLEKPYKNLKLYEKIRFKLASHLQSIHQKGQD